jgi:hypothetical protein
MATIAVFAQLVSETPLLFVSGAALTAAPPRRNESAGAPRACFGNGPWPGTWSRTSGECY